jgi:tetratricopeptide (TPR) repeat protein
VVLEPLSLSVAVPLAARTLHPVLLSVGKALLDQGPVLRAIQKTEADYPSLRGGLGESLRAWLSDDTVRNSIQAVQTGGPQVEVNEQLLDAFSRHSAMGEVPRDAAERFLARFLIHLAQEAAQEETGPWRLENITRYEHDQTRSVLGDRLGALSAQFTDLQGYVSEVFAAQPSGRERSRWNDRINEAKRLSDAGRIRTALHAFEQILREAEGENVEAPIRYRLHLNIGACLVGLDRWDSARNHFEFALDASPGDPLALAHLGQVDLFGGDPETAVTRARAAIAGDPECSVAWLVLLQSVPETEVLDVPEKVRSKSQFALGQAHAALTRGDVSAAEEAATRALQASDRSSYELIEIAQILHVCDAFARGPHDESKRSTVVRLTTEALENMDEAERPSLAARARTLRGVSAIDTDPTGARKDLQRAVELAPGKASPRVGLAHALLTSEDPEAALFVLGDIPPDQLDSRAHAVHARAMLAAGRPRERVEEAVLAARDQLRTGLIDSSHLRLDLIETAVRAKLLGTAEQLLDEVGQADPLAVHVLRARVAVTRVDVDEAEEHYRKALEFAENQDARDIGYEYASFLASEGRTGDAADAFRDAGAENAPPRIQERFAATLISASRWEELQGLLDRVGRAGPLPSWGLEAASMLALRRDDLPRAKAYLEQMIGKGIAAPEASIRLAYALLRMGQAGAACEVLDSIDHSELTSAALADVAKLYGQGGQPDSAIRAAYHAWRRDPSNPEREALLAGMVFMTSAETRVTTDPLEVAPDTWVLLTAVDGSDDAEFFITTDEPIPGRRHEIRSDSQEAGVLLGRRLNEVVVLRPEDVQPIEFRIREIRTVYVRAAQEAASHIQTRIAQNPLPLQSVRLGEPDSVAFLAPMISVLYRGERSSKGILQLYHQGRIPLALLAETQGVALRQAYIRMTMGGDGPLWAEFGSAESMYAAQRAAHGAQKVVVSLTALFTLQRLDLLHVLPALYDSIHVAPSAIEALRREHHVMEDEIGRGVIRRMGPGPRGVEVAEVPADELRPELDQVARLVEFAESYLEPVPRGLDALDEQAERLRDALGPAEADSILAASREVPLYADDRVIRELAAELRGAQHFSTYALLEAAQEHRVIDQDRRMEAVLNLMAMNHLFIPTSSSVLRAALRADGMSLGPRLRMALERLGPPVSRLDGALPVAAAFLRELAQSPLGGGAFRGVVWWMLDLFSRTPEPASALERFDRMVQGALRLLPLAYESFARERDAFLRAKGQG